MPGVEIMFKKLFTAAALATVFLGSAGAVVAPAQAQPVCGATIRVQPGDTLYGIASRCGIAVGEIMRLNGLSNPNYIQLGTVLKLRVGAQPSPTPSSGPAASGTYRVRAGDTLASIARRYGVSLSALASANRNLRNPNLLRPGMVLRIPSHTERPRPGGTNLPTRTLSGTLTDEGITCQAMRGDDGRLYTLIGPIGEWRDGDRIRLVANAVDRSLCQQGTTLQVISVRPLGPPAPAPDNDVVIFGILTDEGVECQAMRDHSGRLYTLTGRLGKASTGDTVQVEGRLAEFSFCQQGTTIEVEQMELVRG
jgi:LysM repeat protein